MKRRDFLKNSIFIPAAGVTLFYTISSCSDDESASPATGSTTGSEAVGTCTTVSNEFNFNHLHIVLGPSAAQVAALAEVTLGLTIGTPGETHTVTLTAEQISDISTCGTATATTSVDLGHSHTITFTGNL